MFMENILVITIIVCIGILIFSRYNSQKPDPGIMENGKSIQSIFGHIEDIEDRLKIQENLITNEGHKRGELKKDLDRLDAGFAAVVEDVSSNNHEVDKIQDYLARMADSQKDLARRLSSGIKTVDQRLRESEAKLLNTRYYSKSWIDREVSGEGKNARTKVFRKTLYKPLPPKKEKFTMPKVQPDVRGKVQETKMAMEEAGL